MLKLNVCMYVCEEKAHTHLQKRDLERCVQRGMEVFSTPAPDDICSYSKVLKGRWRADESAGYK